MDTINEIIGSASGVIQGAWRAFLELFEGTDLREPLGQFGRFVDNIEGSLGIDTDGDISNDVQSSLTQGSFGGGDDATNE